MKKAFAFRLGMLLTIGTSVLTAGTITLVTSEAGLSADDTYHWANFGTNPMPNATPLTTNDGLGFNASDPDNGLSVQTPGAFGLPGDATTDILVSHIQNTQAITFNFNTPVSGVGAFTEWGGLETATYQLSAYGAGSVLLGTVSVVSDSSGDFAFVGLSDTVQEITEVVFTLTGETSPHSAALGDLFLVDSSAPEPASIFLTGAGLLVALGLRRRVRTALIKRQA